MKLENYFGVMISLAQSGELAVGLRLETFEKGAGMSRLFFWIRKATKCCPITSLSQRLLHWDVLCRRHFLTLTSVYSRY